MSVAEFGSLEHTLKMERLMTGRDRRLPVPDILDQFWWRAGAEGYPVRHLYVLDEPLHPGVAGTYNTSTKDVWIYLDRDCPDRAAAEAEAASNLLHEIAHAARAGRGVSRPETIGAYHRDEGATHRLAYRLARRWGVPHLFADKTLSAYLALIEERRDELERAGALAGNNALAVAQGAHDGLRALRGRHGWDDAAWEEALWGYPCDAGDPATVAVADLDRCLLRPTWSLGWGHGRGFEAIATATTVTAARTIRWVLEDLAGNSARLARANVRMRRTRGGERHLLGHIPLYNERDVRPFIAIANKALLGERAWAAEAAWAVYGAAGDPLRYYTLTVSYSPPIGGETLGPRPPEVRLWGVALARVGEVEAALGAYIRGWSRATSMRAGTLRDAQEDLALRDSTARR